MAYFRPPVRAASPSFILPVVIPRLFPSETVLFSRIPSRRSPPAPHPFTFVLGWKSGGCWVRATQSGKIQTLSDAVVVVDDEKYGKKQVISITPQLYRYILDNVREPAILRELREETGELRGSQMQVSPDQAQLLAMLVQILGAQRCIEVGIYTGYSSLAVALVLPESGRLVACERDERCLRIAEKYYERAGVSHKVSVKHALAVDSLESMIKEGEAGSYDFAFVDAEKRLYHKYYELLLELVRPGGVIVIDNVLWHGKVADPTRFQ
ncbi:tricin synthase 1-like isoform X2 [Nymphaea colorata]|uniref:tricin synthase 1-like isoform X2 n=1 Tax=Nymphaea colorata TaxID=210225 RepID=UPI00214EB757|nr:tricin synthase 1-like isoform X2 [Nymphaea colorata]